MGNVNTLLSQRLNKNEKSSKMAEMARQSATGNLTSFTGLFSLAELSENEKGFLETLLHEYSNGQNTFSGDLHSLISITSEVKAINNQAAILHGERIKKAQEILKSYKEGAFTAWLIAAYGNRQTPYNFLQYYEFYTAMPKNLHSQIEAMPRQAIYTLASREGPIDKKKEIVESYSGETKAEMLTIIRTCFPLSEKDLRKEGFAESAVRLLTKLLSCMQNSQTAITKNEKTEIYTLLDEIYERVESM